MNNQPCISGMVRMALLGIGLSVLSVYASIDSGGGRGSVGSFASHSSLGSPFTANSVTAGGIDLLYPLQSEPPTRPSEKPPSGSFGGGGGNPSPKSSSLKKKSKSKKKSKKK